MSKIVSISFLVICFSIHLLAQDNISPYSKFGIGELMNKGISRQRSMGGTGVALRSPLYLNNANPASYGAIDTLAFLWDVGFSFGATKLATKNISSSIDNSGINYMAIGFKTTSRISTSFGVMPFSKVGYQAMESDSLDAIGKVDYYYVGSGGIYQFYMGNSIKITSSLSAGINISYLFGSINKVKTAILPVTASTYNPQEEINVRVGDVYLDYGFQYLIRSPKQTLVILGATFAPSTSISVKNEFISGSKNLTDINSIHTNELNDPIDTSEYYNKKSHFSLPMKLAFGATFAMPNYWSITGDVNFQQWSKFSFPGSADSLVNTTGINLGGEFTPAFNSPNNVFKRIHYRAGLYYKQCPVKVFGQSLNDYGFTVGFGVPVHRSASSFNIGFEMGQRGKTENNLIKEKYYILTLNILLADFWFFRPKFE